MIRSLWFRRLYRWLFVRPTRTIRVRSLRSSGRGRLCLEALEDRTLLSARTFVVTSASDGPNAATTPGTLRYAVTQADIASNFGSTITFSKVPGNTISLSQGELKLTQDVTITGPGSNALTINGTDFGGGGSRVFDISANSAKVTISGLTIANGNAQVSYLPGDGNQGGDIYNAGILTLSNDIIKNGSSSNRGGGIYNAEGTNTATAAQLTIDNTIVENNTSYAFGGGIYNDTNSTLTVQNGSQIKSNTAFSSTSNTAEGGGIFNNTNASMYLNGTAAKAIILADNIAEGLNGIDETGVTSGAGGKAAIGGTGGFGFGGGSGGNAEGGGVYNTGALSSIQYVQFQGDQALGGKGGGGGNGGAGGTGSKATGGLGGAGGGGGSGGFATGGGLYNATGALTLVNCQFTTDTLGVGNEAVAGSGGSGGNGGNGGPGAGGFKGGAGGKGGNAGTSGLAEGGAIFDEGGDLTLSTPVFTSSYRRRATAAAAVRVVRAVSAEPWRAVVRPAQPARRT